MLHPYLSRAIFKNYDFKIWISAI